MSIRSELFVCLAVVTSACAPLARSVSDVRATVRERVDVDLGTWSRAEDGDAVDRRVGALLAAPLGVEQAIEIALLRSPTLQRSFASLGIARADLLAARLPPNPEFDLESRLRPDHQGGDELETHVVVNLTEVLVMPLRRAAAEAELEAAELAAAEAVLDLVFEVRRTFVAYLARVRLEETLRAVVETTRAAYETARALAAAGNVPALDVVTEEALYEESRLDLARAELAVLERREQVSLLLGLTGEALSWEADTSLDDPPDAEPSVRELESRAIERSLGLAGTRFELEALARRHGVARLEGLLPDLRAGVSMAIAEQEPAFGPAVSMTIPLFSQGQPNMRRIDAQMTELQRRYVGEAISVRSSIRRARNRLLYAREQVRFVRDTLLPVRSRVLEETLRQYNAMQVMPFQVLAARREQIEASRTYVEALEDYWRADAAVKHLLAGGRVSFDADDVEREPSRGDTSRREHR